MTHTPLDAVNARDDLARYIADCRTLHLALVGLSHAFEDGDIPALQKPEYIRGIAEHAHRLHDNLEGLLGIVEELK